MDAAEPWAMVSVDAAREVRHSPYVAVSASIGRKGVTWCPAYLAGPWPCVSDSRLLRPARRP